jgi:hypothetical protein
MHLHREDIMHPDAHHPYHTLPWLGRLTVHVAGYEDSLKRGDRRAADRALRHAVIHRLQSMRHRVEEAIGECTSRETTAQLTTHVGTLERVIAHLDRVIERIRANDTRIETSYDQSRVDVERAGFLHAAHLSIFEQAEAMVQHFDAPDLHHDRLPHLEADLQELERLLDAKAAIYRKLG